MELGPFWEELAGYIPDRYFDDPGYQIDRALIAPADWSVDAGIRFWVVGYYPNHATEIRLRQLADKRGYTTQALPGFGKTKTSLIFDPACVTPRVGA
jgi:hypothetical protein